MNYWQRVGEATLIGVVVVLVGLGLTGAVSNWNNAAYWEPLNEAVAWLTATPEPTPTAHVIRIEIVIMTATPGE